MDSTSPKCGQGGAPARLSAASSGSTESRAGSEVRMPTQRAAPRRKPAAAAPFDQLKARLTGENAVSLGQAIQQLRPDLSKDEVRRAIRGADRAAKQEMKAAEKEANHPKPKSGQS